MDRRAVAVGAALTAAIILVVWFARLPMTLFGLVFLGPFAAGLASQSRESKAFEGVASMASGMGLALAGLVVGHFLQFDALPLVWRFDAAFTTLIIGLMAAIFFIPMCCVAGAVFGGVGGVVRDIVQGGPAA